MPTDMSRISWNGWFIHSHHLRQGRSSFFSGYLGIAIQFTEKNRGRTSLQNNGFCTYALLGVEQNGSKDDSRN
jgi:hypothetical protein